MRNGLSVCCLYGMVRNIVQILLYTELTETKKERELMEHTIVWVRDHVEVYDCAGRFCFSADTRREALEELVNVA